MSGTRINSCSEPEVPYTWSTKNKSLHAKRYAEVLTDEDITELNLNPEAYDLVSKGSSEASNSLVLALEKH
jgi:hypothetical protein